MVKKIRLGIVGASAKYGWAMRAHLPAFLNLPEYELVAVCTAHRETAEESGQKYGVLKVYQDYREMVADPDVEVVDVSVRAPMHHAIAMEALRAGKHVFCEWPLGANLAQADEMAVLAREKGVRTMVGLQARYAPSFTYLRQLVSEGYLGRVLSANMTMFLSGLLRPRPERSIWSADRTQGAHTLSIATGHALDVFLWCLGEMDDVQAVVTTQVPQWSVADSDRKVGVTSPDNVLLTGHLVNGALVSVHVASVPWHGTAFRMEAYGVNGTLIATSDQMVEMVDPILRGARVDEESLAILHPPEGLNPALPGVPEGVALNMARMFRRFAEGILGGYEVSPNFADAALRHHTLDTIAQAAQKRAWLTMWS